MKDVTKHNKNIANIQTQKRYHKYNTLQVQTNNKKCFNMQYNEIIKQPWFQNMHYIHVVKNNHS